MSNHYKTVNHKFQILLYLTKIKNKTCTCSINKEMVTFFFFSNRRDGYLDKHTCKKIK